MDKGGDEAARPGWEAHHRTARAALQQGDLGAAERAVEAGLAAQETVPLILLKADVLVRSGRAGAAAEYLAEQSRTRPDVMWLPYKRAEIARHEGDGAGAWTLLGQALALEGGAATPSLRLLAAGLWQDAGEPGRAAAVLETLAAADPKDVWGLIELARLRRGQGDPGAALHHVEAALARAPDNAMLAALQGDLLFELGRTEEGAQAYEALQERQGSSPEIALKLLQASRGQRAGAPRPGLLKAIAAQPTEPRLLAELFRNWGAFQDAATMEAVCTALQGRIPDDLAAELEAQVWLHRLDGVRALEVIRRVRRARRPTVEVHTVIGALLRAGRFALLWRYLRFAMRSRPDGAFLGAYVVHGLRLGHVDEVRRALDDPPAALRPETLLGYRFLLAAYTEDFETALACYTRLEEQGRITHNLRMDIAKLIFTALDPAEFDRIFERIEHPFAQFDKPMHRGGLQGQMMQEFELERRAMPADGTIWTPEEWMRERPGSTMAAIRLIDAWRAGDGPREQAEGTEIPRRIVQYWHAADRPEDIVRLSESWAGVDGVEYSLYDRASALSFLRDSFDPSFVQAFRLAQNAAQESDFLRLCLLARQGGIWADADDALYGDLDAVLGPARGLVLYREPLGGALGNNFLAAPPGHPVIRHAARLACMALRRRDNETTWSKTGPGLLTRAVGHYLARRNTETAGARITVLDWPVVGQAIGMHNDLPYKRTAAHWEGPKASSRAMIWTGLLEALTGGGQSGR